MPKGKIEICRTISWLGDCSLSPTTPKNVMFNNLMQFNTKPSQHKWKGTLAVMDNHNKNIDASNSDICYQMYVYYAYGCFDIWFDHFLDAKICDNSAYSSVLHSFYITAIQFIFFAQTTFTLMPLLTRYFQWTE